MNIDENTYTFVTYPRRDIDIETRILNISVYLLNETTYRAYNFIFYCILLPSFKRDIKSVI